MDRDVVLIVNPSAGGGRVQKLLPAVERWLRVHGVAYRVERTRSIEHARELAQAAGEAGAVAAAFGGDGMVGAVAGALAGSDGLLAVLPGGRGNDFARAAGIPRSPVAACTAFERGRERAIDLGEVDGRRFVGIASCGFDSDANRIANATRIPGAASYAWGALRALAAWRAATFEADDRRRGAHLPAATRPRSPTAPSTVEGCTSRPTPNSTTACSTSSPSAASRSCASSPSCRASSEGTHVRNPEVDVRRGAEVRISADRPFTLYADGDPIAELPATVRVLPGAVRMLVP